MDEDRATVEGDDEDTAEGTDRDGVSEGAPPDGIGEVDDEHAAPGQREADRPAYDPEHPDLPGREPPLRSTAPQSDYVLAQVGFGFVVLAVGLAITVGLALALA